VSERSRAPSDRVGRGQPPAPQPVPPARSKPLSEAVEGLEGTARDWTDASVAHAKTVALRLDDGAYALAPDHLAADVAKSFALVTRGWAQLATALVEAAVKVARPPNPDRWVASDEVTVAASTRRRRLSLAEPLRSPHPAAASGTHRDRPHVEFAPAVLEPNETTFRLWLYAVGLRGTAYLATVGITDESGEDEDSVTVEVVVQVW
jgi:hypothetical protein